MKHQKGQSLIETLVALAMAVIIMSAIALTMITAINSADFAKKQNLATQYAQQGLEMVKQDAQDGAARLGSYSVKPLDGGVFERTVTLEAPNPVPAGFVCGSAVHATVSVTWSDGKCQPVGAKCHKVVLDSCIADSR